MIAPRSSAPWSSPRFSAALITARRCRSATAVTSLEAEALAAVLTPAFSGSRTWSIMDAMADDAAPTRVVIADDDVLLREGIASLLERSRFAVVGQSGNATELLELVNDKRPDLAIIDIRMPPTHTTEGLDAARTIRLQTPDTAILLLSAHVDVEHAMDLLASGERTGYLLKSRVTDVVDFVTTLERIAKGASVVDPALVQELVAARRVQDPLDELSPREREVLALMAEGRSNAGIAQQLWVTEGTVEKHIHSILQKLPLQDNEGDHRRVLAVLAFLETR
jgi:DNA-binding NarL/FixJ family response regulator